MAVLPLPGLIPAKPPGTNDQFGPIRGPNGFKTEVLGSGKTRKFVRLYDNRNEFSSSGEKIWFSPRVVYWLRLRPMVLYWGIAAPVVCELMFPKGLCTKSSSNV